MGTSDILPRRGGCNPATDWYPVQGGVAMLLGMLHAKETRISCGHLGLWLMCAFTFFTIATKCICWAVVQTKMTDFSSLS